MAFAWLGCMRPARGAEAVPSGRRRRILITLLILLLILLPLYLWPLRSGRGGVPGASALSGPPHDPRDPAALAAIPGSVWDDLMGRATPPGPEKSRNLTMIAQLEEVPEFGEPASLGRLSSALGADASERSRSWMRSDDVSSDPAELAATLAAGSTPGSGDGWGGYAGTLDLGPWGSGGIGARALGGSGPGAIWDPTTPPTPTPEPSTIVLIGTNGILLGAAAWQCRRRGRRASSSE
jgi:hypothetical protein